MAGKIQVGDKVRINRFRLVMYPERNKAGVSDGGELGDEYTEYVNIPYSQALNMLKTRTMKFLDHIRIGGIEQVRYLVDEDPTSESTFDEMRMMVIHSSRMMHRI
jgi:hypothetical protein